MTKKDYELIAERFLKTKSLAQELRSELLWQTLCLNFASALEEENPKFDRHKFLQACGIDPELEVTKISDHVFRV